MVNLDENDILLVMDYTNITRDISIRVLTIYEGDVVNSLLYLVRLQRRKRMEKRILRDITNIK